MDVREVLYRRDPPLPEIAGPVTAFDTPELHALVQVHGRHAGSGRRESRHYA